MSKPVDNLCRTCLLYNGEETSTESALHEIKMVPIIFVPDQTKEANLTLRELIKTIVPQLKIAENDGLSKNVCKRCSDKIIDLYNFQQNCIKNEDKFYKFLEVGDFSDLFNITKDRTEFVFIKSEHNNFTNQNNSNEWINDEKAIEIDFNVEDHSRSSIDIICEENDINWNEESKLNISKKKKTEKRSNKILKKRIKQSVSKRPSTSKQHNNTRELYSCGKCQRKLKSKLSLIKHHELHLKKDKEEKELKCNICNQAFSEITVFKNHQRTHNSEKPFLCSECGKGFTSAGSLKQHSFRHLDKKLFPCSDCPKSFPTNGDLLCHYEIHKAKPRIHVCEVCGRGFYKPFLLKQHQRYHNNERPFPCEFCDKRFVTSEKQRRHMRTHTGEKPYRCKYCDRAFAQSNDCIKHLRQHLGDNVYQCELCPSRFPLARDLRVHFASHKDDDEETRSRNLTARIEEEKQLQIKLS